MENKLNAIIIEDEIASQNYLKRLLTAHFPEVAIVSVEDTVQQAIDAIEESSPDIVFVDVEIKSGTGFDVLEGIKKISFDVIFTTAFNQFAIDAFQYHAIDYLVKPLEDEKVIKAVQRCIAKREVQRPSENIAQLLQYLQKPAMPRLPVHTMHGIEFIETADILYIEAAGNYCKIKMLKGNSLLITKKIKDLAEQLQEPTFIRIHQSYLVHTRYVKKYIKGRGGSVVLDDGTSLPVAPLKKNDFLKHFT